MGSMICSQWIMTQQGGTQRVVIVAPTFNNAGTLSQFLSRIDDLGLDIVLVNDGSTDATGQLLARWVQQGGRSGRIVLEHPRNRGKAAALLTAFEWARRQVFTHAITIDTDGQLDPG